jgi:glyoxylase-like metal-dependent hydrolase (beta-lactamase superfamily II)
MADRPTQTAPGVYRLGTRLVNFYLVEDGGRYTVVDAGLPGYFGQVPAALEGLGAALSDVEAVVLTHADADHIGIAERLRTEAQATVHVHEADARMARTGKFKDTEGNVLKHLWRPTAWKLISHFASNGGGRPRRIADVHTFTDGDVLDVPGRPRVIATPGHTYGHVVFVLEREGGVMFTGDALCGRNPLTGRAGPQVMPTAFNISTEQAVASLERIEGAPAATLLFGHGDPWTEGAAEAVERARAQGPS